MRLVIVYGCTLARDGNGSVIASGTLALHVSDLEITELYAIKFEIKFAQDLCMHAFTIESDCKNAVNLCCTTPVPSSYSGLLALDIQHLLHTYPLMDSKN
ncbi:conserved hypothetical protein [Ricinus communis]|uniref:RNase H type-1 domain-containing protein n=1 Tax=Ricinus communis TaxID=3988 RepID=B9SC55_RICCO|nr:conserved hypothetical protein [Ricinus communis]